MNTNSLTRPGSIGFNFESVALRYLNTHGLELVARNYRCTLGEIDLIMRDVNTIVFVEVRFRENESRGTAAETVEYRKQHKIRKTAQHFLLAHKQQEQYSCRFDVLGITIVDQQLKFNWISNAFL